MIGKWFSDELETVFVGDNYKIKKEELRNNRIEFIEENNFNFWALCKKIDGRRKIIFEGKFLIQFS